MTCTKIITASLSTLALFLLLLMAGGCDDDTIWDNTNNTQAPALVLLLGVASQPRYTIGGTISGLTGSGLYLQINSKKIISVPSTNTTFTFTPGLVNGAAYHVTVITNPTGQTCSVTSGGSGTVSGAPVTSIVIECAP
jgi:hypothetical protein